MFCFEKLTPEDFSSILIDPIRNAMYVYVRIYIYIYIYILLVNILNVIACVKERQDALKRTKLHVLTRVAKCIDVDGGIFEHLLLSVQSVSPEQ